MRGTLALAAALLTMGGACLAAPAESIAPLLRDDMPGLPGKQLTAVTVSFPPGAQAVPHRHGGAFLYAYVLEGTIRSQIEGQPARIFATGESWTEKPGDHHTLTQNASPTAPARLLVVFVANAGEPLKTDDPEEPAHVATP